MYNYLLRILELIFEMRKNKMTIVSMLPDLLGLVEVTFGPGQGPAKQTAIVDAISKGMADAGAPDFLVKIVATLLGLAIPAMIKKFNADPANMVFIKPETAS
jgi:hypothetical protein